ncbi:MAG: ATP-binding protein [Methanosphaera sp.]|nr:ATP-binding protein [Methanosphaera sp.]
MNEFLGRCYGETTPGKVSFISKETPAVGEYVYLNYEDKTILGMIDALFRGCTTLGDDLLNPDTIGKILKFDGDSECYIRGTITILGDKDKLIIPRTPAPPGTIIYKADSQLLKEIFEKDDGLKIGTILKQPDVDVKLDVNKMVSRHLAILAMTGSGKSNTTSIIIDELLRLNGTIVVFDVHSEYSQTEFKNGEVRIIPSKINPRDLSIQEYLKLGKFSEKATNQTKYLRDAYQYAKDQDTQDNKETFFDNMILWIKDKIDELESEEKKNNSHIEANYQVLFKLEDMKRIHHKLLNSTDVGDMVDSIVPGKVNVVSLGSLSETATDIIVKHMLNNILIRRKNKIDNNYDGKTLDFPVFCIIEEAHNLASNARDTKSKYTISKIAREGRKFGVGLCLVSQSPKALDSATLSQINNLIILRLVEPGDQKHVQKSSESLSNDLLEQLPSLNIGEAVILGQMTKIPTMVKIDEFKGKTVGNDLDIVKLWKIDKQEREEKRKQAEEELDLLL